MTARCCTATQKTSMASVPQNASTSTLWLPPVVNPRNIVSSRSRESPPALSQYDQAVVTTSRYMTVDPASDSQGHAEPCTPDFCVFCVFSVFLHVHKPKTRRLPDKETEFCRGVHSTKTKLQLFICIIPRAPRPHTQY